MRPRSGLAKLLAAALAVAGIAACEGEARAQGSYRSTPIGGRSALMGSTGIALARDGSAPFLNPATIASISDTSLAFSVNFYSYATTRLTDFHQPGEVDRARFGDLALSGTTLQESRFEALPSTLCLFFAVAGWGGEDGAPAASGDGHRKGRQKLAVCLGNLERQEVNLTALSYTGSSAGRQADQAQSFQRKWNRLYVGPTMSVYLTDDLAIGLSVHGINTTLTSQWTSTSFTSDQTGHLISSGLDRANNAYSFDLGGILGLTYHLDRHYTLGFSVQSPSLHVTSSFDASTSTHYEGAGQYATLATGSGDFSAPPPIRVGAGLGARYGRLVLEGDATLYFPRSEAMRTTLHVTEVTTAAGKDAASSSRSYDAVDTERANAVVNSAFGFEYFVRRSLGLLGGFNTDFSAVPLLSKPPSLGSVSMARTSRAAASFGIGSYGNGSELLFGTELSYAWGRAYAVNNYVLPTSSPSSTSRRSL